MKKKTFVLLEVLLAIGLLSLTLVPLISSPFLLLKRQQEALREMAIEKALPVAFYRVVKTLKTTHPTWNFSNDADEKKFLPLEQQKLILPKQLFPLGYQTFHYHLYHQSPKEEKNKKAYKLWCVICCSKKCRFNKKSPKRGFQLLVTRSSRPNVSKNTKK